MAADLTDLIKAGLIREMETLRDAVRDLAAPLDERQFWTKPLEPGNSFGHLVLHLTGNVSWFIGAQVGGTGYVRDREREFTEANPPAKAEAMARLDEAVGTFRRAVQGLTAEQLAAPHPTERFGAVINALLFVTSHFALHRGQLSYLARLVRAGGAQ
jgi:DinB superfamily